MINHTRKLNSLRISRRKMLAIALATTPIVGSLSLPSVVWGQSSNRTLQQPVDVSLLETRLKMELEVDGEAKLSNDPESKVRTAPIKSKATQDYLESIAFDGRQPIAAARQFITAKSENWVAGKSISHELRPEVCEVRVVKNEGVWEQWSPKQPLDRQEVDLLRSPINTLALEKLFSTEPARVDSQWPISADDAKELFNLDAVQQCTLVAKVIGVEKSTAKIEIEGSLQATANFVSTEIQVRGNAHAILASQCAIISWVGMSIKETREISESQPGFSITARLQLVRQEAKDKLGVTYDELASSAAQDDPSKWLVRVESRSGFSVLTKRNWVTFLDSPEETILRYVEKNRIMAQCNIAPLPKMDAGSQLTLEGLQQDVRSTLGKNFEQMLESSERLTGTQLRLLRCEAVGRQEDVAIQWIYAHLSNDSGKRLLLVFTHAAEFAEELSGADLQILDSLEFKASSSQQAAPTTTPNSSSSATSNASSASGSKTKVVK